MSTPTPAEAFRSWPTGFFDPTDQRGLPGRRSRALRDASREVARLSSALGALCAPDESDLDLTLERYRRQLERAERALTELEAALDAPGGPPPPELRRRRLAP